MIKTTFQEKLLRWLLVVLVVRALYEALGLLVGPIGSVLLVGLIWWRRFTS